uniref:STAC3-related SH3 domain-containing protein n=2 Tax=Tetranychus urticae TaxID=32264 RepID=T1KF86_TETUR
MLHTIQVSDGEGSMVKLLRDQIIIQVGDEIDGIVMIRTGMSDKTISCPAKYVAEVT